MTSVGSSLKKVVSSCVPAILSAQGSLFGLSFILHTLSLLSCDYAFCIHYFPCSRGEHACYTLYFQTRLQGLWYVDLLIALFCNI
jgi:hypothetical protein